jgi:Rv0078B-related antitoxin
MDSRIRSIEVVDDIVAEILRRKTPAERLAIADGMWRFARVMIRAIVAREHPDWSEDEINRQVARRMSHGAV